MSRHGLLNCRNRSSVRPSISWHVFERPDGNSDNETDDRFVMLKKIDEIFRHPT